MTELKADVITQINKVAKKQARHGTPKTTLREILMENSLTKLRELARIHKVSRYTKLNKEDLVNVIYQELVKIEFLESVLMMADTRTWSAFSKVIQKEQLICDGIICAKLIFLQALGLAQTYFYKDKLIAVIPQEIREGYRILKKTGFLARKERSDIIHAYASAATNLYGIIRQDDFVSIFNAQNAKTTNEDEIVETLMLHSMMDSDYCFWNDYIASSRFADDNFEGAKNLLHCIGDKTRYLPNKQEFLNYANPQYYQLTPQTRALAAHLKTLITEPEEAEDIADDLCLACNEDASIRDLFTILTEKGVCLDNLEEIKRISQLLMEVKNNSRIWVNHGHTPNEIFQATHKPSALKTPIKSVKIGRNESCPCGSGKKYKKCCGGS